MYLVLEQLKFGAFNMAPHGKELSEDLRIRIVALHKDGRGYKKFGNTLKPSYSTVARVKTFPRRVSLGTGLARVDKRS